MRSGSRSRSGAGKARTHAARLARVLAVVVFVVGALRAGTTYFYCAAMNVTLSDACCEHGSRTDEPTATRPPCCESHTIGALPAATAAAHGSKLVVEGGRAVAIVPQVPSVMRERTAARSAGVLRPFASGGPPPPAASRIHLMVFLI